jgi:hypothetical protein
LRMERRGTGVEETGEFLDDELMIFFKLLPFFPGRTGFEGFDFGERLGRRLRGRGRPGGRFCGRRRQGNTGRQTGGEASKAFEDWENRVKTVGRFLYALLP